ncbi:MAG: hypothetical protein ACOYJI_06395 [Anaerovoracaceae bacterium]|jgi:hypothetical protein
MAVEWRRLHQGRPKERDLLLLKHELIESKLEKKYNLTLAEAHARETEKYDWYSKLVYDVGEGGESNGLL